jgi:hypothetical protein
MEKKRRLVVNKGCHNTDGDKVANLFYEPVGMGNAHEKCINITLGEGQKTVEDHEVLSQHMRRCMIQ